MPWWKNSSHHSDSKNIPSHSSPQQQLPDSGDAPSLSGQLERTLLFWLNTPRVRARRGFLEAHPELLSLEIDAALSQLIGRYQGQQAQTEFLTESRLLIQDARAHGATRDAIRDAYVNFYGGLALEVPRWLDDIALQFEQLSGAGDAHSTIDARLNLLRGALSRNAGDAPLLPEVEADVKSLLERTLREIVDQRRPLAIEERIVLLQAALGAYVPSRYPRMHANMLINLGATFYDRIAGDRSENIEQAIACYREALRTYTLTSSSINYSHIMNNLGNTLVARIAGTPRDNLEEAITCFRAALAVRTREAFPDFYAQTMSNLGNAFLGRIAGNRKDNLEEAITCYRESLRVRTRETSPTGYAETMINLGSAYARRVAGQKRDNLDEAVACYRAALLVFTRDSSPYRYAQIMNNLGVAYKMYTEISQEDRLDEAIVCFREALSIQARDLFPHDYAVTIENLGFAYVMRRQGRRRDNLEEAVACFREALRIHSRDAFPQEYARLMDGLGTALSDLARGESRASVEEAIACFRAALRIRTREAAPLDYAQTLSNLGETLRNRMAGERRENIEEAIACLREAATILTSETSPVAYALIVNNLGNAYVDRIAGEKRENLEEAIACYHQALTVFTADISPSASGKVNANLAVALVSRVAGNRQENLEEAIACFHTALRVYTRENSPEEYAETLCNLGEAFKARIEGGRSENLEQAIICFQQALQVRTLDDLPADWARIQFLLGDAYHALIEVRASDAAQGESQRHAIEHFTAALTVFTREAYPELWALTMQNLGDAYGKPDRSHEAEHLDKAITCYSQALTVYTRETTPVEWAITQASLGQLYVNRRVLGNVSENVERAIVCCQSALEVLTLEAFPRRWASVQSSLGYAYISSIHSNVDERTERAIACYTGALQVIDRESLPRQRGQDLMMLGSAFILRALGNRAENIEQGIRYCHEALHLLPRDDYPFYWARTQDFLSNAYMLRIRESRDENLEKAIAYCTAAMEVYSQTAFPFEWAKLRHRLGDIYLLQTGGREGANIERAIACYTDDLSVRTFETAPVTWALTERDLGSAYGRRVQGNRNENLRNSAACYAQAFRVFTPESYPSDHHATALIAANIEMARANWAAADALFSAAQQTESLLLSLTTGVREQDIVLARGRNAATSHAYALIQLGRREEALLVIEQGRARAIAEARALDTADPARIGNPVLRERYVAARTALINTQRALNLSREDTTGNPAEQPDYLENVDAFHHAKQALDAVVGEIRAARDPADFLRDALDLDVIWRAAERGGQGHALVYLLYTPWGGAAIAAISANPQNPQAGLPNRCATLTLPALLAGLPISLLEGSYTPERRRFLGGYALAQSANGFKQLLDDWPGTTLAMKAEALHTFCTRNRAESSLDTAVQAVFAHPDIAPLAVRPLDALDTEQQAQIAATLEYAFLRLELERSLTEFSYTMRTVTRWLERERASSVTIIPCGMLAAFPLLAAPINDTEQGLPSPQEWRTLGDVLPASLAPSARALLPATSSTSSRAGVYTIGDPQWDTHPLPWSETEARVLAKLAQAAKMEGIAHVQGSAIRARLLDAIATAQIVDVSCHGVFDGSDVLRSRLFLAGGESLLMGEVLGKVAELGGLRLFLLSACQTALVDVYGAADEVHSLTTSMLQAGAEAVLGSLWSVDDQATYLLMARFAQEWFPRMTHEPPAAALARAQRWLRNVTNRELQTWQNMPLRDEAGEQPTPEPQQMAHRDNRRAAYVGVRGRGSRYSMSFAQTLVRQRARQSDADERPFADPIYWAAFQLSGW